LIFGDTNFVLRGETNTMELHIFLKEAAQGEIRNMFLSRAQSITAHQPIMA